MSYNPTVGALSKPFKAATEGFHLPVIKTAVTVVAGSFITSFLSKKISGFIPGGLGSSSIGKVATTLLTAGLVGAAAKKVIPARANELFAGGVISGVTEGLNEFLPDSFKSALGMKGWDLQNEWSGGFAMGDFADPRQMQNAFNARQPIMTGAMHGMRDFTSFKQIAAAPGLSSQQPMNMGGIADFADPRQIQNAFGARQPIMTGAAHHMHGLADDMIGEEIEMM